MPSLTGGFKCGEGGIQSFVFATEGMPDETAAVLEEVVADLAAGEG